MSLRPGLKLLLARRELLLAGAALIGAACRGRSASERPLRVAAAADLEPAFTEVASRFTAKTGRAVVFSFGSSGALAHQIDHGAPLDLYAAASPEHVERLRRNARLIEPSVRPYARGQLAVWARSGASLPKAVAELAEARFSRIALANPEHAPYGQAAVAALRSAGIYETVRTRLVFGENVRQAQQLAQTGDAEVALTALSLALRAQKEGPHLVVPAAQYPVLSQTLGVVRGGDEVGAARFADFLLSPDGQSVLRAHGFLPAQ